MHCYPVMILLIIRQLDSLSKVQTRVKCCLNTDSITVKAHYIEAHYNPSKWIAIYTIHMM